MTNLEIERKLSEAEESYKKVENAWGSSKEIRSRIDALIELARELKESEVRH